MTALVLYGSSVASSTLSTANKLATTTGGTETTTTTTAPNDNGAHEYIEALSQGGTDASGSSTLPAQSGKGWLLDSTVLEGQTLSSGNYIVVLNFNDTGVSGYVMDGLTILFSKRSSGGTYTTIGSIASGSVTQNGVKLQVTFPTTSLPSMAFSTGDKFYAGLFYQSGSVTGSNTWSGDSMILYLSNSGTAGVANDMQITTPGYSATGSTTHRIICDGYGGMFS